MKQKYYSIILLILIAIAATIWQLSGVAWVDDLQYMRMPGDNIRFWYNEGPMIESFSDACRAIFYHHTLMTSRLPNYIQCFFNLISPFIVDLCHGIMIGIFVYTTSVITAGSQVMKQPFIIGLTSLSILVFLPWYDNMLSSVFLLNYVWVSVICLFFILIFLSDKHLPLRLKWLQWPLALIAGTTHEGFTFPIITACVIYLLINKGFRNQRQLLLTIIFAIGIAICFFTPGIFERVENRVLLQSNGSIFTILKESLLQIYPIYILMLSIIIVWVSNGLRFVIDILKEDIIFVVIIVVSYTIALVSGTVHRGLWLTELSAIILTIRILQKAFSWWQQPHLYIGLICGCLTIFSLTETAIWQSRLTQEIKNVCQQVETTGKPIAYLDIIDTRDIPWWTLKIPQSVASSYGNRCIRFHYGFANDMTNVLILPSRFKNKPIAEWETIPGSANAMGQYPFYVTSSPTNGYLAIKVGKHTSAANLAERLASTYRKVSNPIETKFGYYWIDITENGDTIYCHNIDHLSRTMRNRKITAINNPDKLLKKPTYYAKIYIMERQRTSRSSRQRFCRHIP